MAEMNEFVTLQTDDSHNTSIWNDTSIFSNWYVSNAFSQIFYLH
jgi:hypothetical protein